MVRRLNKRGQEEKLYFFLWEIIAVAMVFIIVLVALRGIVSNSGYWKRYYSTDLALMADLENTNQGDFVINYGLKEQAQNFWTRLYWIDAKMFEIFFKKDRVETYQAPKEENKYPTIFTFSKHKDVTVVESSMLSNFLVLSKQGSEMKLSEFYTKTTSACAALPTIDTQKDTGYLVFKTVSMNPDNAPTGTLANSLNYLLKNNNQNFVLSQGAGLIVAYEKDAEFTIYYSAENELKSHKLACIIGKSYALSRFSSEQYSIKPYGGFLDTNQLFNDFVRSASVDIPEFWVIVKVSDKQLADPNYFAIMLKDSIELFYG